MGDATDSLSADPALLSKIDRLFACGVGEYVDLPQIVVVGDQSSGKSSVLEGLTKLPFPRDSDLCTRFATKIIFRRSPKSSITASVIPAENSSSQHLAEVKKWEKLEIKKLDAKSFEELMTKVHTLMGVGGQDDAKGKKTFSEDVLQLEVCGPQQEHFSVVDVPGIFRKDVPGVTTPADIAMVRAMVQRYMKNSRSIMLAVVPANVDIATQEILTMAEGVDKEGVRTLGVLTKPDLVDEHAEQSILEMVEGSKHPLKLSWCIIRNPGQKHLKEGGFDRRAIESEFFQTKYPWNTLEKDRVGIDALLVRLRNVLTDTTREEFPKVRAELTKKLKAAKDDLAKGGAERGTPAEQRAYLTTASALFERTVNDALITNYAADSWFDTKSSFHKLVTYVVTRNEKFAQDLERFGNSYRFCTDDLDEEDKANPFMTGTYDESKEIKLRMLEDNPLLNDLDLEHRTVRYSKKTDILVWLEEMIKKSRGFELGTFNSNLLASAMKAQAFSWEIHALAYISDVITMVHGFIGLLIHHVCPNTSVRNQLKAILKERLVPKYQAAFSHVRYLLEIELTEPPLTLNHYFNENLEKSRTKRVKLSLEGHKTEAIIDKKMIDVVKLDNLPDNVGMSNSKHTARDFHDILKSYYKVARKRFVDNVCMQATNHILIKGPESPLEVFSPVFVSTLTDEQLEEIAGEDAATKKKRAALKKEIADLEAGRKIVA